MKSSRPFRWNAGWPSTRRADGCGWCAASASGGVRMPRRAAHDRTVDRCGHQVKIASEQSAILAVFPPDTCHFGRLSWFRVVKPSLNLRECGRDPPDPVALEKAFEGPALNPPDVRGRRSLRPEVEEPGLDHASDRFEDLRIVAPQLLSHAVRQANAVPRELLGDLRPRPEFDDDGVDGVDPPEVVKIGPQRVGEDPGVEAVSLAAAGEKRSRNRSSCFGLIA